MGSFLLGIVPGGSAGAAEPADEKSAVEEILGILKERGDIGDEEYQRLVAKNAKHEEKEKALLPKIRFFGDLRNRFEHFDYGSDATNSDLADRSRLRYRVRFGASAEINDYVSATFRLATGENDTRSRNQTAGRGVDFGPDTVAIDWAYLTFATRRGQLPVEGGRASLMLGKVQNPFRWSTGRDLMLWDSDITPEGASFQLVAEPISEVRPFLNAGYFLLDENWSSTNVNKDPNLFGLQGGAEIQPIEDLRFAPRISWYAFRSLDASFIERGAAGTNGATASAGNIADGLTGDTQGGSMDVGELAAYLTWSGFDEWPVTFYGGLSQNFAAERSRIFPSLGPSDLAWNGGVEVGDKAKWVRLGTAFFHVEANAFPSQFIDSNILDGDTNREAWIFYATRQLFHNTDLTLWLSKSNAIDEDLPVTAAQRNALFSAPNLSNTGSDRIRLMMDLEVKF